MFYFRSMSMTARIDEGRKAAFLRALGETGNLTLSAERAGVSRHWARLHRKENAAFDADYLAALAKAGRQLGRLEDNRPAQGWRQAGGAELVVVGRKGRRRIVRGPERAWTPEHERRFLAAVRETNNLKYSCYLTGSNETAMLKHRKRWPGFERRLQAARKAGSIRLALQQQREFERALALGFPTDPAFAGIAVERPTIQEMINLARRAQAEETMRLKREERARLGQEPVRAGRAARPIDTPGLSPRAQR
jgi:hypothetical protein